MVRIHYIDVTAPLTDEQKAELEAASKAPIVFDDDCPELTDEQLKQFKRVSPERRVSLNRKSEVSLSEQASKRLKSLGESYNAVVTRVLEDVLTDESKLEKYIS